MVSSRALSTEPFQQPSSLFYNKNIIRQILDRNRDLFISWYKLKNLCGEWKEWFHSHAPICEVTWVGHKCRFNITQAPQQWWEVAKAFQHGGWGDVALGCFLGSLYVPVSRRLCCWEWLDVISDNRFLSLLETSIQTSFSMTVKVDGVSQDGTTMYIHNKVHNRTRTLTCAGVSVFDVSTVSR